MQCNDLPSDILDRFAHHHVAAGGRVAAAACVSLAWNRAIREEVLRAHGSATRAYLAAMSARVPDERVLYRMCIRRILSECREPAPALVWVCAACEHPRRAADHDCHGCHDARHHS